MKRSLRPVLFTSLVALGCLGPLACTTHQIIYADPPVTDGEDGGDPGTEQEDDGGTKRDSGKKDADVTPSPATLSFPQVLSRGGPVIKAPKIVPISFAEDNVGPTAESFTKKLVGSTYWAAAATEYGIGAITALPRITVTETAPTNIDWRDIETWLVGKLSGATPEFGAPDVDTLYAIYYPRKTVISQAGELSCQAFGGYHSSVTVGTKEVGYAVLPQCSDTDYLTIAASHEYFEWATDPYPMTRPAYNKLDDEHWAWALVMLGELSDMCTILDSQDPLHPTELGFEVQRHWSNKLSKAGSFPCGPQKTGTYLQAIPQATDPTVVPDYGAPNPGNVTTKAIKVDRGKSRTVDVFMYGDKPSKNVQVQVVSYEEAMGGTNSTGFKFSLDARSADVGDTIELTVKAPSAGGYDLAVVMARDSANTTLWPVLVTTEDRLRGFSAGTGETSELTAALQALTMQAAKQRVPRTVAGMPPRAR